MPFAPGVQMQQVPGMSLGKAIGVHTTTAAASEDVDFELDAKIRGESRCCSGRLVLNPEQDIMKAKMTGDATSDEDEDMESDGDSGPVPTYPRLGSRAKRQGGGGMAASKGKSGTPGSNARGNGKGKGKASNIVQGYSANFDADARLAAASVNGNAPRRKRTFFNASSIGLPPLLPPGVITPTVNGTNGKAAVAAQLKQGGGKNGGKGGDGKRSRRGSPASVA